MLMPGRTLRFVVACALLVVEPPTQERWTVDTGPVVDIAGASSTGEVLLGLPSGAARLPNGTIVVADRFSWSIRYFSEKGELVRTVGREGDGPGEFRGISWLGRCAGDTIFVWDFMHRRMSALDPAGRVSRQFRLPLNPTDPVPYVFRCSGSGSFALLAEPLLADLPARANESARAKAPLVVADSRGEITGRIGEFVTREFVVAGQLGAPLPRPLGRETSIAITGNAVFVGTADSAIVEMFGLDGSRRRAIRIDAPSRRPTRQLYERAAEELVAYQRDAAWQARFKKLFLEMPMPATLPPYSAIFADTDGVLWVVHSTLGDSLLSLSAHSNEGRLLSTVTVPRLETVFEIGTDYILGSYQDSAGYPHVASYRLRRGR